MSTPGSTVPERLDSNAPVLDEPWRRRPIEIFSVLKSFIYQLRPGQDLTRISSGPPLLPSSAPPPPFL